MKALYTISEVARYFDVSNQTLHYYDRIGLLKPSCINANTKYRYYDQQQFNKMFMIQKLKYLGFSLDEIKEFEKNKNLEVLGNVLQKNCKELEKKLHELQKIRSYMDFYLKVLSKTEKVHRKTVCDIKNYPTRHAFYINVNFEMSDLSQYVEMLYKTYVKIAKLQPSDNLENRMILTMHKNRLQEGQFRYYNGIGLLMPDAIRNSNKLELPASLYATTVHIGEYTTIPKTYKKLCKYVEQNSYSICGYAIEISYTNIVLTDKPDEFVTEIQIPVEPKV